MDYGSFKKETYDNSLNSFQNGDAEENWTDVESGFGEKQKSIKIDKSWNFLSILFQDSPIGNFITGTDDSKFELEEITVCIFSIEYLKDVCQYLDNNQFTEKETFLNFCKLNNEYSAEKGDYYFENLLEIYNLYSDSIKNDNWVLGMLM